MRHYHLIVALERLTVSTLRSVLLDLTSKRDDMWKRIEQGPSDPDTDRAITEELITIDEEILKIRLEMAWRKNK
jgi:hypothetical protein